MPDKDGLEALGVDLAGFDKLKQTRLVLGPSELERDSGKVLSSEHPSGLAQPLVRK